MKRRTFLALAGAAGLGGLAAWRGTLPAGAQTHRPAEPWAAKLVTAARGQIGVTTIYDPAYAGLDYPAGDIPIERGVCSDVVIRAYREAHAIDLQKLVHEDMRNAFSAYPKTWGLKRPDRNIDHRRVPNLERFLTRKGAELTVTSDPETWQPGDLVTHRLPGNLPHIAIISDRLAADGATPLLIHNIGAGAREENRLFEFDIAGHFRLIPPGA